MTVTVHSTLGRFAADCVAASKICTAEMRGVIRRGVMTGNQVAKDNARRTAGRHGRRYPSAFTWEVRPPFFGFGAAVYSGEYGPDIARPQGDMEFEWGSRNQEPHLDLNKSADLIGPAMPREVGDALDKVFWP